MTQGSLLATPCCLVQLYQRETMPAIELPNGASAIIKTREEITERVSRQISRAYIKAAGTAAKLASSGFDENDPTTWTRFADLTEEDQDNLDGYQAALIVGMVSSWSLGDLPTLETTLDLPKPTFEALAAACSEAFNQTPDFSPHTDPKAPTAD